MRWADVGEHVKNYAPLIASLLTAPVSAPIAVVSLLASTFGLKSDCKPQELLEAIQADSEAHFKLAQLQLNHHAELEKLQGELLRAQSNNVRHEMLKEYSLDNKFKSYWRPAFGYMVVIAIPIITIWLIGLGSYVFFVNPQKLSLLEFILTVILSPIINLLSWCVGILGINIYHRSKDKSLLLGTENSILANIAKPFKRK